MRYGSNRLARASRCFQPDHAARGRSGWVPVSRRRRSSPGLPDRPVQPLTWISFAAYLDGTEVYDMGWAG